MDGDMTHPARPEERSTLLASHTVALCCLTFLCLAFFGPLLFADHQFAYRDASQTYYPLYMKIQQEWSAGRWPLWMPEINGGVPLLANPVSAVFYPGKLVYAVLPYAWAARVYVVLHILGGYWAMFILLRTWGISVIGSALAGLSYAFSGPIVFQYSNVVYLVGAAWMPLGVHAIDGWLRQQRRSAVFELALVLSMQMLGGDPESAYLLGVAGAAYCVWLYWQRLGKLRWALLLTAVATFYGGKLLLAARAASFLAAHARGKSVAPSDLHWLSWPTTLLGWGLILVIVVRRWPGALRGMSGLAAAAALAIAVCAIQLWPTLEFGQLSVRAADCGIHDVYPLSLEPQRLLELAWPNAFGTIDRGNHAWLGLLSPNRSEPWEPSLYLGGFASLLAFSALGWRGEYPWRGWLAGLVVVSILGSLGEYGSPLFWVRRVPQLAARLGPPDPPPAEGARIDGALLDGDGGPYWLMTASLPGFGVFRYPSKLLTLACLGLAGLAGMGWDDVSRHGRLNATRWGAAGLVLTLVALGCFSLAVPSLRERMSEAAWKAVSAMGPLDVDGALADLSASLWHAALVLTLSVMLIRLAQRWPRGVGFLALMLATADLSIANSRIIWTVPQSLLDQPPRMLGVIQAAEQAAPSPGPFRIQRMALWEPVSWLGSCSLDRMQEVCRWQHDTLQPLGGISLGLESTFAYSTTEMFDLSLLFDPLPRVADAREARLYNFRPGEHLISPPRASFDLWNTRYFIVPARLAPGNPNRAAFSFLGDAEVLYPVRTSFEGPGGEVRRQRWLDEEDVQVLRNKAAFPRAWVVHRARFVKPITGMNPNARRPLLKRLRASDPRAPGEPGRGDNDLREVAWVETDHPGQLGRFLQGAHRGPGDLVTFDRVEPQHLELTARLQDRGLVVLADVFYPGWELTIDRHKSEILRVNRMMRGAAVEAGSHQLVFTYNPRSFRIGMPVSLLAMAVTVALFLASSRKPDPRDPIV